jgi:hypothetical protein
MGKQRIPDFTWDNKLDRDNGYDRRVINC